MYRSWFLTFCVHLNNYWNSCILYILHIEAREGDGMWDERYLLSRRRLLASSGLGFGSLALADLLNADTPKSIPKDLSPRPGHFPGSAKSVIQLVQVGGPSQMDLFDP